VEALGHGKAIVATTTTVQGFEDLAREAVAVADDPDAFAAAILTLLHDRTLRIARGAAALANAATRFSPEACYSDFVAYVAGATVPENRSATAISD
jgi:succinoglycan biosynthesis protein ExoO